MFDITETLRSTAQGASLPLRDPWYDGTAIKWADFFNYAELRDKLRSEPGTCLFDALHYDRLDRVPDIVERDPAALERPFAQTRGRADASGPDGRWREAVQVLLDHGADVTARHPDGRSPMPIARDQGFEEIASLLQARGPSK